MRVCACMCMCRCFEKVESTARTTTHRRPCRRHRPPAARWSCAAGACARGCTMRAVAPSASRSLDRARGGGRGGTGPCGSDPGPSSTACVQATQRTCTPQTRTRSAKATRSERERERGDRDRERHREIERERRGRDFGAAHQPQEAVRHSNGHGVVRVAFRQLQLELVVLDGLWGWTRPQFEGRQASMKIRVRKHEHARAIMQQCALGGSTHTHTHVYK